MSGIHPEPTEPRIIKKKKNRGGGAHGGAWKVAYADFVTAMMALFIVLWIMSQSQTIRQNVAQYFKNPGLLPGATGLMENSDMGGEMPTPGHSQDLQTPSPLKPDLACERDNLEQVRKRISEIIAQLPELRGLKDQIILEITDEGLRIELLDRENSHFFDLGSTDLKPETRELLKLISQELGKLTNHIIVEGHTDSRPYGTKSYTNWELSTDRANAARRFMENTGVKPGQIISVRGFADRQLRNQQDPMDVQNRRVTILVMFPEAAKPRPVEITKIGEDLNRAPEKTAPPGPPALSLPKSPDPGTRSAPEPEPPPGPALPVFKSTIPPPPLRLEDQVREEVRQLVQQEVGSGLTPGSPGSGPKNPRSRLGW
jgi:chemotaxis protein MotB|uniref:Flagellar motor protein MotB n=1 Tax=Desulfobacca acetoxidans TaxID=60893 RepID=A0A7C3YX35_9BACT